MLLAMGFGLSVKETALLIQCALFITGIATIIQSFGIGKHIGARLPIVSVHFIQIDFKRCNVR